MLNPYHPAKSTPNKAVFFISGFNSGKLIAARTIADFLSLLLPLRCALLRRTFAAAADDTDNALPLAPKEEIASLLESET